MYILKAYAKIIIHCQIYSLVQSAWSRDQNASAVVKDGEHLINSDVLELATTIYYRPAPRPSKIYYGG